MRERERGQEVKNCVHMHRAGTQEVIKRHEFVLFDKSCLVDVNVGMENMSICHMGPSMKPLPPAPSLRQLHERRG